MKRANRLSRGFTLIEVLVVISIIGVLAGLVGVIISKANEKAMRTGTITVIKTVLDTKIRMFKQEFGRFPMSNIESLRKSMGKSKPYKGIAFVDGNEINASIELLMVQLRHPDFSKKLQDDEMDMIEDPIGNIDDDSFAETPVGCRDSEAREVLDAWGSPIVYFFNGDYEKTFTVRNHLGEDVEVVALKRKDGTYYNPDSFQLISLGPDGVQNMEEFGDDVTSFKVEDSE
ncbi:MAG: prepilin-type N-terminal cleavage/methylation domain-containing protein [Planctomycetota bacterium]